MLIKPLPGAVEVSGWAACPGIASALASLTIRLPSVSEEFPALPTICSSGQSLSGRKSSALTADIVDSSAPPIILCHSREQEKTLTYQFGSEGPSSLPSRAD